MPAASSKNDDDDEQAVEDIISQLKDESNDNVGNEKLDGSSMSIIEAKKKEIEDVINPEAKRVLIFPKIFFSEITLLTPCCVTKNIAT